MTLDSTPHPLSHGNIGQICPTELYVCCLYDLECLPAFQGSILLVQVSEQRLTLTHAFGDNPISTIIAEVY